MKKIAFGKNGKIYVVFGIGFDFAEIVQENFKFVIFISPQ